MIGLIVWWVVRVDYVALLFGCVTRVLAWVDYVCCGFDGCLN